SARFAKLVLPAAPSASPKPVRTATVAPKHSGSAKPPRSPSTSAPYSPPYSPPQSPSASPSPTGVGDVPAPPSTSTATPAQPAPAQPSPEPSSSADQQQAGNLGTPQLPSDPGGPPA